MSLDVLRFELYNMFEQWTCRPVIFQMGQNDRRLEFNGWIAGT